MSRSSFFYDNCTDVKKEWEVYIKLYHDFDRMKCYSGPSFSYSRGPAYSTAAARNLISPILSDECRAAYDKLDEAAERQRVASSRCYSDYNLYWMRNWF